MERLSVRDISICFAGGCLGAMVNSLLVWYMGRLGVPMIFEVKIAPEWTMQFLYPRLVWGGLWGLAFLLPFWKKGFWTAVFSKGVFLSFLPTAFQLFYVFPFLQKKGSMGVGLGSLTPLFVFFYNAVWGFAAAWWVYVAAMKSREKLKW